MAAAMTSCSSATLGIQRFANAFAGKVYEQIVALIQSRSLELYCQNFKTCQFNESRLFICRLKSEYNCSGENARNMHVSWMMLYKQGALKIFKCWNSVVFPSPNKISGYAPCCTAGIYQKILWFVFDLIYVVIISSSIFYLSKLTKFELIITIYEHNCVYLSSQNWCVFILNSVLSAEYLDITQLYTLFAIPPWWA